MRHQQLQEVLRCTRRVLPEGTRSACCVPIGLQQQQAKVIVVQPISPQLQEGQTDSYIGEDGQPREVIGVALEGGGGSAVPTGFVFAPGQPASDGVFATWATLAAAVASVPAQAKKTIAVDDSAAAAHATTGTWPGFENCEFVSGGTDSSSSTLATLIFDTGARLSGVSHFYANTISLSFADATGTVIPATTGNLNIEFDGVSLTSSGGQGLATLGAGFTLSLRSFASGLGTNLFKGSATSTYVFLLFAGSAIATNTVNGTAGGTVVVIADGASQAGVAGTTQTPAGTIQILDPVATFVFKPGAVGAQDGNVFTTWAALYAAASLTVGNIVCHVDPTLAAAHMTAGAYNLNNWRFTTEANSSGLLTVDDGVTFVNTFNLTLSDFVIFQSNATHTVWTTAAGDFYILYLDNGATFQSVQATAPISVTGAGAQFDLFAFAKTQVGDGTHPVMTVAVGPTAVILAFDEANIQAHAVAGLGAASFSQDACSIASQTQDVTTPTYILADKATSVSYTPATVGNWQPAPTQVKAALDQLAAPNFVQSQTTSGSGTGTTTAVTGNIAKLRSGKVNVSGIATGISTSATTTITVSLLRDATPIFTWPAITVLSTTGFAIPVNFIDTLPDTANHTYTIKAVAAAGNITSSATGNNVQAIEL